MVRFVRKLVWLQAEYNFVIRARWAPKYIDIICDSICHFQRHVPRIIGGQTADEMSTSF